jgi:hypothetical protein
MGIIFLYHLSTAPIQILIVLPNSTTACAIFTSLSDMQMISLTKIMLFLGLCVSLASGQNIIRSNRFARCLLSEELFWKTFHLFQLQPTQQTISATRTPPKKVKPDICQHNPDLWIRPNTTRDATETKSLMLCGLEF